LKKASIALLLLLSSVNVFGSDHTDDTKDVIVIGAGLSGLNAARTIHAGAPHARMLVLEGRERLGGRTWTHEGVEMGGEIIDTDQVFIQKLVKELGLKLDTVKLDGEVFGLQDGQKLNAGVLSQTLGSLTRKLTLLQKTLNPVENTTYCDNQWSYTALLPRLKLTDLELRVFRAFVQDDAGHSLEETPLVNCSLWASRFAEYKELLDAKSSFLKRQFLKTYTFQYRVQGGTIRLCEALAEALPKGAITLNTPVSHITRTGSHYRVATHERDFFARHLVVSAPFSVLRQGGLMDMDALGLPREVQNTIHTMPYGVNGKVIVPTNDRAHINYFIDANAGTAGWSNPKGVTFIATLPNQVASCEAAVTYMGLTQSAPSQSVFWSQDPFSRGSWSTMVAGEDAHGVQTRYTPSHLLHGLTQMAGPFNNDSLFFVGEHTCDGVTKIKANKNKPIPTGYMQSALFSGQVVGTYLSALLQK